MSTRVHVPRPPFARFDVPTHGVRRPHYFVYHMTEGHGTVESLAAFFRSTPDGLGTNYCCEPNGRLGSNGDAYSKTYHVLGGYNDSCMGCEMIGMEADSHAWYNELIWQMRSMVWLSAWVSQQLNIPLQRSMEDRKVIRTSGFCRHMDVPDNDHTDPGTGFPIDRVLTEARRWCARGVPKYVQDHLRQVR